MNKLSVYNPFVVGHYVSDEYFCDRRQETDFLRKQIVNGRNVVMISPRRIGKSDLIHHFFHQEDIKAHYYTFFVDIYATSSLAELAYLLGKSIFLSLKPRPRKWMEHFFQVMKSLRVGFTLDSMSGDPSFNLQVGDIASPEVTLHEIFDYLSQADRHCIVAIDEFQQIAEYQEKNVEAVLRTYVQQCPNANFIYAGSKRDVMSLMFHTASRPFYESAITMSLDPIPEETYVAFASQLFQRDGRTIDAEVIQKVYDDYEGCTWFVQMIMNELFAMTPPSHHCAPDLLPTAQDNIIQAQRVGYQETLMALSAKQRRLLIAIARERRAEGVTSSAFIKKYSLSSASSVQSALRPLVESGLVTCGNNQYRVYDYFLAEWIRMSC